MPHGIAFNGATNCEWQIDQNENKQKVNYHFWQKQKIKNYDKSVSILRILVIKPYI